MNPHPFDYVLFTGMVHELTDAQKCGGRGNGAQIASQFPRPNRAPSPRRLRVKSLPGTVFCLLGLLSAIRPPLSASPLSTAFTYQGRLNEGGNPAQGS
jgi:hypothetical protein